MSKPPVDLEGVGIDDLPADRLRESERQRALARGGRTDDGEDTGHGARKSTRSERRERPAASPAASISSGHPRRQRKTIPPDEVGAQGPAAGAVEAADDSRRRMSETVRHAPTRSATTADGRRARKRCARGGRGAVVGDLEQIAAQGSGIAGERASSSARRSTSPVKSSRRPSASRASTSERSLSLPAAAALWAEDLEAQTSPSRPCHRRRGPRKSARESARISRTQPLSRSSGAAQTSPIGT